MSAFLVALDAENGSVVGYAGLLAVADEGCITKMAVRPDCRRGGVAGQLLDVFIRFAEGSGLAFLTLEVRESNYAAIALYGSRGFRGEGRRKNYYDHPKEDAIIMTKEFGAAEAVARQFFCETRTEFLRKNSPVLRSKSETRSLASTAPKMEGAAHVKGRVLAWGGAAFAAPPLAFCPWGSSYPSVASPASSAASCAATGSVYSDQP